MSARFFFEALAPAGQGPLLWQHLFWFFGHPEVYIIFLPALGIVSSIVTTFARRPLFGYTAIVLSTVATGFPAFGLWVHHKYNDGLAVPGLELFHRRRRDDRHSFGRANFLLDRDAVGGRPQFKTPLPFVLGFFFIFVLGGLTGVMIASVPFDAQVHDTFFIVAHFHYVLIGGAVFPLFGGLYRLQENVVQVFQPALSRFGAGFVATKGFFAGSGAGWKTCATFLFLEVYITGFRKCSGAC